MLESRFHFRPRACAELSRRRDRCGVTTGVVHGQCRGMDERGERCEEKVPSTVLGVLEVHVGHVVSGAKDRLSVGLLQRMSVC